jgi:hypothetical protein
VDNKSVIISASLILAVSACAGDSSKDAVVDSSQIPAGKEQKMFGCELESGYNVCPPLLETYQRYKEFLGMPVASYNDHTKSQSFVFGVLSYNPGNPQDYQVQLDNLGSKELTITGRSSQPDSEIHPALRDCLNFQQENGFDTTRIDGRIISPAIADRSGNMKQYAEKQVFIFPSYATSCDQVQRMKLGLLNAHIIPVDSSAKPVWQSFAPLAVGGSLLGLVAFLLKRNSSGGRRIRTL